MLESAGNKPEAHIFSVGGHGFGTRNRVPAATTGSTNFKAPF